MQASIDHEDGHRDPDAAHRSMRLMLENSGLDPDNLPWRWDGKVMRSRETGRVIAKQQPDPMRLR